MKLKVLIGIIVVVLMSSYMVNVGEGKLASKASIIETEGTIGGVEESDYNALVALYEATNGDNWYSNNWFENGVSVKDWDGITVKNCRVVKIELAKNLSGIIPTEIEYLTELDTLDLGSNKLSRIPNEIWNLPKLIYLDISYNSLEQEVVFDTNITSELQYLNLYKNLLYGEIPAEIGELSNLTYIDLGRNCLSEEIPAEIRYLTKLRHLYLGRNCLHGEIPTEIGELSNLEIFKIQRNQITKIPKAIQNLDKLKILSLLSNQLKEIPIEIGNLKEIEYLYIGENQLHEVPSQIGSLQTLKSLSLKYNHITRVPKEVWELQNVHTIDLRGNRIPSLSNEIEVSKVSSLLLSNNQLVKLPPKIVNLVNLNSLFLEKNQLKELPSDIDKLTNLTSLHLEENQLEEIPSQIKNLNSLKYLYLAGNKLRSLPSGLNILKAIFIEKNNLSFSQLEILAQQEYDDCGLTNCFKYHSQAKIGEIKTDTLNLETPFQAIASAEGTQANTQYQWYKDGIELVGKTDSVLTILEPQPVDIGAYICIATNSIAEDLILQSHPHHLVFPPAKFTVDQSGNGDYTSIEDGIQAIQDGNIEVIPNQSIVFDLPINSDPYEGQIIVPNIEDIDETTTLTLDGNGNTLTFSEATCENPAVIQVDGADHIIIKDFHIEIPEDALAGWGIHLKNGADSVQIINCTIDILPTGNDTCFAGIVASKSDFTFLEDSLAMDTNARYTQIRDCHIRGGYAGIAMIGSPDTTMIGPIIKDNTLEDVYHTGVLVSFVNGVEIFNNQITLLELEKKKQQFFGGGGSVGIAAKCVLVQMERNLKKIDSTKLKKGLPFLIQNNQVRGIRNHGIHIEHCYSTDRSDDGFPKPPLTLIANNIVEGTFFLPNGEQIGAGIYIEKSWNLNFYHNTVALDGFGEGNLETALYLKNSRDITILNNSLSYYGVHGYGMYIADNSAIAADFNNYYVEDSPLLAHYNGTDYATLEEIFFSLNSISAEPIFIFVFDDEKNLIGTALDGVANIVPFDFEGDNRPDTYTLKPDIGANEFIIGVYDGTYDKTLTMPQIDYYLPNQWKHSIYKNDTIAASIKSSAELGEIITKLYINEQGDVRQAEGRFYLDRNFYIEVKESFSSEDTTQLYLYITKRELNNLIAADEQVNSIEDINLTYIASTNEGDLSSFSSNSTQLFLQQNSQQITHVGFVLSFTLTGITDFGQFWLHGGDEALVVGIENISVFEDFSIYPNPSNNRFRVEFDSPNSNLTMIKVWDSTGKLVHQHQFNAVVRKNRYELEALEGLSSGIYLVEVRQGERKEVGKVLKR